MLNKKINKKGRQPSAINYVGVGVLLTSLGLLAPPEISFFHDYNTLSSSSFKNSQKGGGDIVFSLRSID
jgi:hypothetical protein